MAKWTEKDEASYKKFMKPQTGVTTAWVFKNETGSQCACSLCTFTSPTAKGVMEWEFLAETPGYMVKYLKDHNLKETKVSTWKPSVIDDMCWEVVEKYECRKIPTIRK